jgi:hypothetical protein
MGRFQHSTYPYLDFNFGEKIFPEIKSLNVLFWHKADVDKHSFSYLREVW